MADKNKTTADLAETIQRARDNARRQIRPATDAQSQAARTTKPASFQERHN